MGTSREDKAVSHDRIVAVASRRMREAGTAGPGVADLMREAGLTHGGFYKHFGSRDELVAEAVERTLADNEAFMTELLAGSDDPLGDYVDWYLSAAHRDDPGAGCGIVALGADVPRSGTRVREAYRGQVERYLEHLAKLLGDRDRAPKALSLLVGGVQVARALGPGDLSDEILAQTRDAVKALAA